MKLAPCRTLLRLRLHVRRQVLSVNEAFQLAKVALTDRSCQRRDTSDVAMARTFGLLPRWG